MGGLYGLCQKMGFELSPPGRQPEAGAVQDKACPKPVRIHKEKTHKAEASRTSRFSRLERGKQRRNHTYLCFADEILVNVWCCALSNRQ